MKTANISLNVQAVQSRGMDKSASVKDKSFENYFSKNTANTSEKAQPVNVKASGKKEVTAVKLSEEGLIPIRLRSKRTKTRQLWKTRCRQKKLRKK